MYEKMWMSGVEVLFLPQCTASETRRGVIMFQWQDRLSNHFNCPWTKIARELDRVHFQVTKEEAKKVGLDAMIGEKKYGKMFADDGDYYFLTAYFVEPSKYRLRPSKPSKRPLVAEAENRLLTR